VGEKEIGISLLDLPISSEEIGISFADLCISAREIHKWRREICKFFFDLGISGLRLTLCFDYY